MGFLIVAFFTMCFAMVAKRLSSTIITAPMMFIALGALMAMSGLLPTEAAEQALHVVAEIALIILLFLDAAKTDLRKLLRQRQWPTRMLLLGLPLAIAFGTVAAWALLPAWPLVALALVAAITAPTDAALGQAVVMNEDVPVRSRSTLIVESGLNDGLALPAILLFASLTAYNQQQNGADWLVYGAKQLLLGPLVGALAGWGGGRVFLLAQRHKYTDSAAEGIGAIALAASVYLAAIAVDGNGFIAVFVAGLMFGSIVKGKCKFVYEFTESEGQLLSWAAFFLLGLALVPEAIHHLTWQNLAFILASLFIVRPAAIWIALMGSDAPPTTRLFFGWFGPRGLATALFALVVASEIDHSFAEPILMLAVNMVWISALLHGITAAPGARWYGKKMPLDPAQDAAEK